MGFRHHVDAPGESGVPKKVHGMWYILLSCLIRPLQSCRWRIPHCRSPRDGQAGFPGDVSQLCWYSLQKGEKLPQCSACTHRDTHIYTCTHMHIHIHICTRIHMHTQHSFTHSHTCTRTYIHAQTHTYIIVRQTSYNCSICSKKCKIIERGYWGLRNKDKTGECLRPHTFFKYLSPLKHGFS